MTLDPAAMTRLLEITGGDQEFVDELIDTFIDDARRRSRRSAPAAAGDIAAVVRPAHSLKSNAANVGATVLADLCRALEADARAGDVPGPGQHGSRRSRPSSGAVSAALLAERAARLRSGTVRPDPPSRSSP